MLQRIDELAAQRADFAFETTLSSRSFAPFLRGLAQTGYDVHLLYQWLVNPDLAVKRVAERVTRGGHHVPDDVVRRRYHGSLVNFFQLYLPLAKTWHVFDNSGEEPVLIAHSAQGGIPIIVYPARWQRMQELAVRQ